MPQKLSEAPGQQFIVDNKPGAAAAAQGKNDGHTPMRNVYSAHVINPPRYKNAGHGLVAHNAAPPKNVAERVAAAKAVPGRHAVASARS